MQEIIIVKILAGPLVDLVVAVIEGDRREVDPKLVNLMSAFDPKRT